jgi:hypothetical protein
MGTAFRIVILVLVLCMTTAGIGRSWRNKGGFDAVLDTASYQVGLLLAFSLLRDKAVLGKQGRGLNDASLETQTKSE